MEKLQPGEVLRGAHSLEAGGSPKRVCVSLPGQYPRSRPVQERVVRLRNLADQPPPRHELAMVERKERGLGVNNFSSCYELGIWIIHPSWPSSIQINFQHSVAKQVLSAQVFVTKKRTRTSKAMDVRTWEKGLELDRPITGVVAGIS